MQKISITIHHSIYINRPRETVWDYTQDYSLRPDWDKTVIEAKVLQTTPQKIVELKTSGNTIMKFVYKVYDRPNKTSLALQDIKSRRIISGGGSWNYQEKNGGTLWTQTNTLIYKPGFLNAIFMPMFRFSWKREIRKSMWRAKRNLEKVSRKW